ncbi:MAG: CDGSH iron-sulfur domain-containing protein [Alphaproteobacteria bacterium]|nr:CDGSH iron-sulfur domain-containing protein [Alphaproteobacteria bacterium]
MVKPYIKITKDGPYMAFGIDNITEKIIVADNAGISVEYADGKTFKVKDAPVALCRCGRTKNPPFCDGSHLKAKWNGHETASFTPIMEQDSAEATRGATYDMLENINYCAFARFCDAKGRIWNLVQMGGRAAAEQALKEANLCPAGRFVMLDKSGNVVGDTLPPEISTIEDASVGISGPLWIKGNIRVESEGGKSYEIRMKQTLCRCGRSNNKPFCDGSHAGSHWKAGE